MKTLEQADKRLQAAGEQASSSTECAMVFPASCIATAGELAAQPKLAEISKDAARRSK